MDNYFKIKLILEFIIPLVLLILAAFIFGYLKLIDKLKRKLMVKFGYTYDKALGYNVELQYQSNWYKGKIKIYCREVNNVSYFKLKDYIKTKEGM